MKHIRIGLVGAGFMGKTHLWSARNLPFFYKTAELGFEAEEARLNVEEIFADAKSGKLTEAFGTGTAAVISPVGTLALRDEKVTIGDGGIGKISQKLYDTITGIQTGKLPDEMGWRVKVGE